MRCDRCGRDIQDGPMVTMGAKRPYRSLCRTCWGVETRSSNTRLISALNEMTRKLDARAVGSGASWDGSTERRSARQGGAARRPERRQRRDAPAGDPVDRVEDRRHDPDRPQWHL